VSEAGKRKAEREAKNREKLPPPGRGSQHIECKKKKHFHAKKGGKNWLYEWGQQGKKNTYRKP